MGRFIQAQLKVGKSGDKYEQQADHVADKVMQMPDSQVQRQAEEKKELRQQPAEEKKEEKMRRQPEKEEKEKLQRQLQEEKKEELQKKPVEEKKEELRTQPTEKKEELKRQPDEKKKEETVASKEMSGHTPTVTPKVQANIQNMHGKGQPLPDAVRSYFEPRFGADFSQVRVHKDTRAAETAKDVNVKAFTVGRDLVFGPGQYDPQTRKGKQLLAHELAHVVQQNKSQVIQRTSDGEPEKGKKSEKKEEEKYQAALEKIVEAWLETPTGKEFTEKVKDAATSKKGIPVTAMVAFEALAVMVAEKMDVPEKAFDLIPDIELGETVKLNIKPIWKGPLTEKPKEWGGMITLDISFGAKKEEEKAAPGKVAADREKFVISGIVLDPSGKPLSNCRIELLDAKNKPLLAQLTFSKGTFEFGYWSNPFGEDTLLKVKAIPQGITSYDKQMITIDLRNYYLKGRIVHTVPIHLTLKQLPGGKSTIHF